jgi:uncharacterized MAPEG superfamily protein
MTVAFWCVLVAGLLPLATVAVAKASRNYDNAHPRTWLAEQQGLRRRADFAHRNHYEAFPWFAASVIVAALAHASQERVDILAVAYILLRLAYTAAYLGNRPSLRSVLWIAAFCCALAIFCAGARGH